MFISMTFGGLIFLIHFLDIKRLHSPRYNFSFYEVDHPFSPYMWSCPSVKFLEPIVVHQSKSLPTLKLANVDRFVFLLHDRKKLPATERDPKENNNGQESGATR